MSTSCNVAPRYRTIRALAWLPACFLLWADPARAATTFVVNDGADVLGSNVGDGRCETAPGNGLCTLRRALAEAQALLSRPGIPADVTILIRVPTASLSNSPAAVTGEGTLSLIGAGQHLTTIETIVGSWIGTGLSFYVAGVLRVSGVSIRGSGLQLLAIPGQAFLDYVTISGAYQALSLLGDVTLTGCDIRDNGGVFDGGPLTPFAVHYSNPIPLPQVRLRIRRSTFHGNRGIGAGAISMGLGALELDGVTFSDNQVSGDGGAISLSQAASLRAVNTTFSGNRATGSGGAIFMNGRATGAGVPAVVGTAVLTHVTLTGNRADADGNGFGDGGAIAVSNAGGAFADVALDHTIVAGNQETTFSGGVFVPAPGECAGPLRTTGPTVMSIVDCPVAGVAPTVGPAGLGPLQDNGGPTETRLPLVGSLAIDLGTAGPCHDTAGAPLARDQRGGGRLTGAACDLGAVEVGGAVPPRATRSDLDGDGRSDLVWRQRRTGANAAWFMDGATIRSGELLTTVNNVSFAIVATDDFDGDGKADLLWHRADGTVAVWLMDGPTIREAVYLPSLFAVRPPWRIAGTGDMDGDGRADVVWERNTGVFGTGETLVWLLDGVAVKGFREPPRASGWNIAGIGDANGDGTSDLLWRSFVNGAMALWLMSDGALGSALHLPTVGEAGWTVADFADLNGDGKADILWRNTVGSGLYAGATAAWLLDGGTIAGAGFLPTVPAAEWTVRVRDTDGDGRGDLIWQSTAGRNARWRMDGMTILTADYLTPVPDTGWEIR